MAGSPLPLRSVKACPAISATKFFFFFFQMASDGEALILPAPTQTEENVKEDESKVCDTCRVPLKSHPGNTWRNKMSRKSIFEWTSGCPGRALDSTTGAGEGTTRGPRSEVVPLD